MLFAFLATRAGKFVAAGVAVAIAVAAFMLWLNARERAAVNADRAKAAAEATQRALAAERAATATTEAFRSEAAQADAGTRGKMKEAEDAHPDDARKAAGPVSRAAADSLRSRQGGANPPAR